MRLTAPSPDRFTVEVTSPTDSRPVDNPFPKLPGPKPAAARRGGKKQTGPTSAGKEKKQNCPPPPQPRGKRSKMKRAKEKYKDQDDEEREARMAILQVKTTTFSSQCVRMNKCSRMSHL